MSQSEVIKIFQKTGALLEGHFLLSSGLHSREYLQCALVLSDPACAEKLCRQLGAKFQNDKIDLVIGPAYGGIIVAYELARALGVRSAFTERKDGLMQLRRGFRIEKGQRVLVAEDVVTTGSSVNDVIKTIKSYQPQIIGIAALIDRSSAKAPFGAIRFESLEKLEIKTYRAQDCPLCKKSIPLVKPGSRA